VSQPVVHFEVIGKDPQRRREYFGELFGWQFEVPSPVAREVSEPASYGFLDAIKDHNEIRDAVEDVANHEVGSDSWHDAVAAANKANGDHMAEEEREGLTDFRRHASLQTRHDLAVAFAAFETAHVTGVRPVDKDPQEYIDAHTRSED
jgi:hypothetical protein